MVSWPSRLLTMALLTTAACAATAGERLTFRDAAGRRDLVIEQGMSGSYIVRDSGGRRIGTGHRRMDGSIAIFDMNQKRIGTLESRQK